MPVTCRVNVRVRGLRLVLEMNEDMPDREGVGHRAKSISYVLL